MAQNLSGAIERSIGEELYLKFTGKLFVKETKENSLLLLCNTSLESPAYFDKAFVIFSETSIPRSQFNTDDVFEIQVPESKRMAIIYNITTNKIYFIGLTNNIDQINTIKTNAGLAGAISNQDYLGYGLSFLNSKWDASKIKDGLYKYAFNLLDYANIENLDLAKNLPPVGDEKPGHKFCNKKVCSSGGTGSTSCSISEGMPISQSCTVACNGGYYTCCDSLVARCFCCKN